MNRLFVFRAVLGVIAVIVPALWGCNSPPVQKPAQAEDAPPPSSAPGSSGFAESRPRARIRDELTVAFSKGGLELDFRKSFLASEAQLFTAVYEGLFSYHPFTMEPVRAVAEQWEVSDDKKQWTFTLRQNAKYWNGDPVTAGDFRAAWISLLSPERESPYSSLFDVIEGAREYRTGAVKDPSAIGVSAPDARTLVVRLNSPASFFPAMLCHHSFSPIHPSMLRKDKWEIPVSNGPYRIVSMNEDSLALEKAGYYWDADRVALNKITLQFTETGDDAARLWNSGKAHWISGDVNREALTDLSGIQVNTMFATHYYFIRSSKKPWDDYRVRRALALALPWDEIRDPYQKNGISATTLIYPLPGYPEIEGVQSAETSEAARLLAEAGYAGGAGLPDLVIRLTPSPEAARIGGLMASVWKEKLGVPVRVEVIPYDRYFQAMKEDGYAVGSSTWIGDFADPYTFLQMWRRDSNLNDARYSDDDYEALMERSMLEEGQTRWATLAEAEQLLLNRGSVLPIYYSPALNIVDINELDGWFPNALDIHPFKYLSFKAFRPLPGVVMAK